MLAVSPDGELIATLDPGDREAIQLTMQQKADVLIMDERRE
jgi:predicted nucleic acid-binding protein